MRAMDSFTRANVSGTTTAIPTRTERCRRFAASAINVDGRCDKSGGTARPMRFAMAFLHSILQGAVDHVVKNYAIAQALRGRLHHEYDEQIFLGVHPEGRTTRTAP